MAILNYTTKVPIQRTLGEITSLLVRKGARSIQSEYGNDGSIEAVAFVMPVAGNPVRFVLPNNVEGVLRVLRKQKRNTTEEQAERVSWRILKDWIEAQLALIESGQAELGQVFMPYAVMGTGGQTMYELFLENNQKRLAAGDGA